MSVHLPTLNSGDDIDAELRAFEVDERARLGLSGPRKQWADNMLHPEMKRAQRGHVTILNSGLTRAQDYFVEGALSGLGYHVKNFGVPTNEGLQVGKEFGNRGQCNPTYFTVGNLVKYLIDLRDQEGMSTEDIIKNYVFLTAGACGPCRFGMYVTEYRKALRDAGFDGFRVMLFQQQGGLSQATGDDVGLEMKPPFFIAIVKALVAGDVMNALGYRIRPYEVEQGATDRAMDECKKIIYTALQQQTNIFVALYRCRKILGAVKVDRLRSRAKVSIIGEFWAMTTEGDGNYALQAFLESEGAEKRHPAGDRLAPLQRVGGRARHPRTPVPAHRRRRAIRARGSVRRARRRQAARDDAPHRARAARAFRRLCAAGRPSRLPPARHGRRRRRGQGLLLQ
jgi:hypothetical protein